MVASDPGARPRTPPPPLFASMFSQDGATCEVLVWPDSEFEQRLVGEWTCEVKSPGGVEAVGSIRVLPTTKTGELHTKLLALFDSLPTEVSLWGIPTSGDAALSMIGDRQWPVQVWNRLDEPMQPSDWRFVAAPGAGLATIVSVRSSRVALGPSFFVEVDVENEPVFLVMRTEDSIGFDFVAGTDGARLAPQVVSPVGSHTAYWRFQRQGASEAALAAAMNMLDSLKSASQAGPDAVIAAGHAVLKFRQLWSYEPLVTEWLKAVTDIRIDADLLGWVLDFEKGGDKALFAERLPKLLSDLVSNKPYYSETLRLFYERMRTGIVVAEGIANEERQDLREAKRYVERLVASTYWDGEHLSYRGRSPGEPDPAATPAASDKKKKLAALPRDPLTAKKPGEARRGTIDARGRGEATDRRPSNAPKRSRPAETEFDDKLVHVNKTTQVVKGGRRFNFSALVVVGDRKGTVGIGHGKAREVPDAIRKATEKAKRSVVFIPLREGRTLHHDTAGSSGAGKVILRSAPKGTGIIAGGAMRAVFEMLGLQDVVAKSMRSSNAFNMTKATLVALRKQESPEYVAARRDIAASDLRARRSAPRPGSTSKVLSQA